MKVTDEEVRLWLGGCGNLDINQTIEIIKDVANGDYEATQLYKDISDYGRNR